RLLQKGNMPTYKKPKRYIKVLNWCLTYKWVPISLAFIIFISSIGLYFVMPKGSADASDNDVSISLSYTSNKPFAEVKNEVIQMETMLKEEADVEEVILFLGTNPEDAQFSEVNSQNTGQFHVVMKDGANSEKFIE